MTTSACPVTASARNLSASASREVPVAVPASSCHSAGYTSAAFRTLLSMTSRSAFIREQLVQHVLAHTLVCGVFSRATQRVTQSFARQCR
ncbi:MAG: hypothetical protein KBE42_02255 [Steroidobacteraceae bacterium]|nr:hypothetical protein [Steroidobacteraceae bacterium]